MKLELPPFPQPIRMLALQLIFFLDYNIVNYSGEYYKRKEKFFLAEK